MQSWLSVMVGCRDITTFTRDDGEGYKLSATLEYDDDHRFELGRLN
jgi:hypothetical protein